jgi:hypothetical protein
MVTCRSNVGRAVLGFLLLGACVPAEPAGPGQDASSDGDATTGTKAAAADVGTPQYDGTASDVGNPANVTEAGGSNIPDAGDNGSTIPDAGDNGSTIPDAGPVSDASHDAGGNASPVESGAPYEAGGCSASDLSCDGGCAANDTHNCGSCGHDCTVLPHVTGPVMCLASGACSVSASSCAPGWAHCAGKVDLGCETDLSTTPNCGVCGNACSGATTICGSSPDAGGGYACISECSAGTTQCTGTCVDTTSSAAHCGSCNGACPSTVAHAQPACDAGACTFTCNTGYSPCSGACVDEQNDPSHCGGCATTCTGSTPICLEGACVACTPGAIQCSGAGAVQSCETTGQWAAATACITGCCSGSTCSGSMPIWYQDADGDGYGNKAVSMASCTKPTGYVADDTDCCDTDANAHPGQTMFFTVPDACGSFDYNCDGVDTPKVNGVSCGAVMCVLEAGTCVNIGGCGQDFSQAACGQIWTEVGTGCPPAPNPNTGLCGYTAGVVQQNLQACN